MKLNWDIDKNVISKLYVNGNNIIYPWGFETADSSAFFSLEEGIGWRYKSIKEEFHYNNTKFEANIITQMKEGKWALEVVDEINIENEVIRMVKAECLEDTYFMDFVMRFRFKKEWFNYAKISDKTIYHKKSNIYHQYPVNVVQLIGDKLDLKVSIIDSIVPTKMEPVMYVRDSGDEWVVHVRMLPKIYDKEVIKICTKWAQTRPLPRWLTHIILKNKKLKKYLWYRGELSPSTKGIFLKIFNPSAYPMTEIEKGTKLMWKVRTKLNEKRNSY